MSARKPFPVAYTTTRRIEAFWPCAEEYLSFLLDMRATPVNNALLFRHSHDKALLPRLEELLRRRTFKFGPDDRIPLSLVLDTKSSSRAYGPPRRAVWLLARCVVSDDDRITEIVRQLDLVNHESDHVLMQIILDYPELVAKTLQRSRTTRPRKVIVKNMTLTRKSPPKKKGPPLAPYTTIRRIEEEGDPCVEEYMPFLLDMRLRASAELKLSGGVKQFYQVNDGCCGLDLTALFHKLKRRKNLSDDPDEPILLSKILATRSSSNFYDAHDRVRWLVENRCVASNDSRLSRLLDDLDISGHEPDQILFRLILSDPELVLKTLERVRA